MPEKGYQYKTDCKFLVEIHVSGTSREAGRRYLKLVMDEQEEVGSIESFAIVGDDEN